jgi:hypothetical protein
MALVGRDQDVRDLVARTAKVVVLAGDSGVGKSEVLRAAQEDSGDVLAPAPVSLRRAPGALQRGLLESLADAVAEVTADQSTAERVGGLVVAAAGRVANAQLKDLAAGVGRQLLGIISSRVSPELATLLGSFAQQLVTTVDAELSARINNAGDQDVVDLVCGFGSEVRTLADGRRLVLGLDDGDHLDESDRRRLSDLATFLPDGVIVRVAYSTWSAQTRDHVDELIQLGVEVVELEGIDEDAIREWLIAAGLPGDWAPQVHRTTNGYALHVAAAIGLLSETRSISDLDGMQRPDLIGATTRRVWRELDTPLQVAAQRLCAFPVALRAADAANYLGVDLTVWHTLERGLTDSRVFAGHPPWFHELRRRYILSEVLEDEERNEVLSAAIAYREDQLALPEAPPEAFVEYARLTALHTSQLERNPQAAAVMAATRDEVAIAGALIELSQPTPAAVLADSVLLYAHQVFGASGDLVAALQRIGEKGFVYIASNAQATVLVPTWQTVEVLRLFAGRAAAELGRLPTPQLATVVFETAVRPQLGVFRSGHYGLGSPRIFELSRQGAQLQRVQADGTVVVGRLGPNLLLRYEYDSLPLYAALAYDDDEERDAAAGRLDGRRETVSGRDLAIIDCLISPVESVPSLRFYLAMERLRGTSLVNATNGPAPHPPKLENPISLDEEMRLRAATLASVREMSSTVERLASSLDTPIGYLYRGTRENSEAIHVIGRTGAERLQGQSVVPFGDAFYRVELARTADFGPGERLGLISWHQGVQQNDPVLQELLWVFQQSARFNEHQRRVVMKLDAEELSVAIAAASARAVSDALHLQSDLEIAISDEELRSRGLWGSKTCVVLHLDTPDPHWVPGAHATVMAATIANDSGEETAEVVVLAPDEANPFGGASFDEVRTAFADHFGVDPAGVDRMTHGVAIYTLAELLGHRTSEVWFEY